MPGLPRAHGDWSLAQEDIQLNDKPRDRVTQAQKGKIDLVRLARVQIRHQNRQSPQTVPTLAQILFQQDPAFFERQKMEFGFSFNFLPLSFFWERLRIPGCTKGANRAKDTEWLSRRTDRRPQLHQRGIQKTRIGSLNIVGG